MYCPGWSVCDVKKTAFGNPTSAGLLAATLLPYRLAEPRSRLQKSPRRHDSDFLATSLIFLNDSSVDCYPILEYSTHIVARTGICCWLFPGHLARRLALHAVGRALFRDSGDGMHPTELISYRLETVRLLVLMPKRSAKKLQHKQQLFASHPITHPMAHPITHPTAHPIARAASKNWLPKSSLDEQTVAFHSLEGQEPPFLAPRARLRTT